MTDGDFTDEKILGGRIFGRIDSYGSGFECRL